MNYDIVNPTKRGARIKKLRWMGDYADYDLETIPQESLALELWRRRIEGNEVLQYFEMFDRTAEGNINE